MWMSAGTTAVDTADSPVRNAKNKVTILRERSSLVSNIFVPLMLKYEDEFCHAGNLCFSLPQESSAI